MSAFQSFLLRLEPEDRIFIRATIKALLMGTPLPKNLLLVGGLGKSTLIALIQYLLANFGQTENLRCYHEGIPKTIPSNCPVIVSSNTPMEIPTFRQVRLGPIDGDPSGSFLSELISQAQEIIAICVSV